MKEIATLENQTTDNYTYRQLTPLSFACSYNKDQECCTWIRISEEESTSSIYKIKYEWVDWFGE